MSATAHATDPAPVEQVVVSPASQAVIDALTSANTQVMEAAGASSALDIAVTNANTQITEANATSTAVNTAVVNAQTAVAAIDPAIQEVVTADPTTTYQNSEVVQTAQDVITQAQTVVDSIQPTVTSAQIEVTQATTAVSAIAPIIADANTQVYQANQAIAIAQAAVNALEGTISTSHSVLANIDDAGVLMALPFDLLMGGTLYHNVYVGSNATITFGVNQGSNYYSTPTAPSVSVGGYDWTTWSQGSGITYSTTATSLEISWDVRPYPQMDFSTVVNQLRFDADVNPTSGAWIADVTGTGPNVGGARWNYRATNNGAVTQIVDTDLSQGVAGSIGQGDYVPVPLDPNAPDISSIETQIADANQTLFGLQYMITSVASNIGTDTARANALPQLTASTAIANANSAITTLSQTIETKASELQTVVDQFAQAPTPPPVPPSPPEPVFVEVPDFQPLPVEQSPEPVPDVEPEPDIVPDVPEEPPVAIPDPEDAIGEPEVPVEPPVDPAPEPEPLPEPEPVPELAPEPESEPAPEVASEPPVVVDENTTAETWEPAVAPEEYLAPEEIAAYEEIGLVPNSADQLPTDIPKEAPQEVLVAHIQVDVPGVENGGIEFFGTKDAPQVVGEDGKLTPPAPPPGSGLPIPPDAITTTDTFIGQPGGTTFNAPDVAVPVAMSYVCKTVQDDSGNDVHVDLDGNQHSIEQCTFLPAALDAIPGAGEAIQALGAAFNDLQNIGNDMSPVTRQKAKKILVATILGGVLFRRRFGD